MNLTKTKAIIIKSMKYSETSKIVTLFSEEYGKFNAIVKGGRSLKSGFRGSIESISLVNIILHKKDNRELQVLRDCELVNGYRNIKSDFEKINIAYELLSLLDSCFHDYDKNDKAFSFITGIFDSIENTSVNLNSLLLFSKIGLLKLLGFEITNSLNNETFNFYNSLQLNVEQREIVKDLLSYSHNSVSTLSVSKLHFVSINESFDRMLDEQSYKRTNRNTKSILKSMTI